MTAILPHVNGVRVVNPNVVNELLAKGEFTYFFGKGLESGLVKGLKREFLLFLDGLFESFEDGVMHDVSLFQFFELFELLEPGVLQGHFWVKDKWNLGVINRLDFVVRMGEFLDG